MQQLTNHTKIVAALLSIAALSIALIFFGIRPLLAKISETEIAVAKSVSEIETLTKKIEEYKQAKTKLELARFEKETLSQMFPIREDAVYLVESLEDALAKTGLTATLSITDDEESNSRAPAEKSKVLIQNLTKIDEVAYTLEYIGNYRESVDFLLYAENLPFF